MSATLLLTVEEAAAELHIARRRVFELIRDGPAALGQDRPQPPDQKLGPSRLRCSAHRRH